MANEGRYRVTVVRSPRGDEATAIAGTLNGTCDQGWRFIQGWATYAGKDRVVTTLVFERKPHAAGVGLEPLRKAVRLYDDAALVEELAAADDEAVPVGDPLLEGLSG